MILDNSSKLIDLYARCLPLYAPAPPMSVAEWIEARMHLPDTSAIGGCYSLAVTPYLREPLEALTDPRVREVAGQKSSQIGWTMGLVMGWQGYTIDHDPAPMIVMFPRDKTARDFNIEKFEPVIEASPALASKIEIKTRSRDYRQDHKTFPGGFIKFVGSNSTGGVKSTSAKRLIVEEPDDCNANLKGQGDSIELLRDRGKTYQDTVMLVGGTPTVKGVSAIEAELNKSDRRQWHVPCHHCGEAAPLTWDNVRWSSDATMAHPVYGTADPDTARYVCTACGGEWTNNEKTRNSAAGAWVASAPFTGIAGFYFNELMSPFAQCALPRLVERYLAAKHDEAQGDVSSLITFWNGALGLPWEYTNELPDDDALKARALDYPELTVPAGGLLLTAGVDVQHDRLAIVLRAWGRGEESWLIYFGELYGNVLEWPVWEEAYGLLFARSFRHANGAELGIRACSIDASDGQTDDAVYKAVREFNRRLRARRCMAVKGSSTDTRDIFSTPRRLEVNARTHKAHKYGLPIYMVGTARAKDLILGGEGGGRINLTGTGPGRIHAYRDARPDYWEQLLSEIKAPVPGARKGTRAWQKKSGRRNEALDCEVYALHAARSLRVEIFSEARWAAIERQITQPPLFTDSPIQDPPRDEPPGDEPPNPPTQHSTPTSPSATTPQSPFPPRARPDRIGRRPGFVMGFK